MTLPPGVRVRYVTLLEAITELVRDAGLSPAEALAALLSAPVLPEGSPLLPRPVGGDESSMWQDSLLAAWRRERGAL